MRILYLHQYFATHQGGTGTRSLEQALALQNDGHTVTMVTSAAQLNRDELPPGKLVRRGPIAGIDCVIIDIPYDQSMSYLQRVCSFFAFMVLASWFVLTTRKPDLVLATSTPLTIAIPALTGKFFRRIPYLFEVRDLWPDVPAALGIVKSKVVVKLLRWLERLTYRHSSGLVAVNTDMVALLQQRAGRHIPVVSVPNACDTALFRPDRDGSWFRKQHNLENKILAIHTGTMGLVNGLDSIVDAAVRFRDNNDLVFVLIGKGKEKARLVERVRNERLNNLIILDSLPKNKLADVLATADIGLMTVIPVPILELNCANKFFDYLAAGLPIVLNYKGWQADLLEKFDCGRSAAQSDTRAFADQIDALAKDSIGRLHMNVNARHLAEGALNRQFVVKELLWIVRQTLAGNVTR